MARARATRVRSRVYYLVWPYTYGHIDGNINPINNSQAPQGPIIDVIINHLLIQSVLYRAITLLCKALGYRLIGIAINNADTKHT